MPVRSLQAIARLRAAGGDKLAAYSVFELFIFGVCADVLFVASHLMALGNDMSLETDVLIVGGGPVGLALGIELGLRGIATVIVDPLRAGSERHPRARYLNLRSVQHLRRWGISSQMRERAEFKTDWASDVYFLAAATGPIIERFEDAFLSAPPQDSLYPEPTIQILQWQTEEVLRAHLTTFPSVVTRFGKTVVSVSDGEDAAVATLGDAESTRERTETITARYVVGCDGGRSVIRRSQGFVLQGRHYLAKCLQIIFSSSNFYDVTKLGPALQYWILNDGFAGFIQTVSPNNQFLLSLHKLDETADFTVDEAKAVIRAALGDRIDFTIDGFDPWIMRSEIAAEYRRGRFFLVGDAGRQHPTFGGHGMNVGLSDAVDLGWKLAAVCQGWAPDGLLDTFTQERRPVGMQILDLATRQFSLSPKELRRPHLGDLSPEGDRARAELRTFLREEKREQFRSLGAQLGYSYAGSPLIVGDGRKPPEWNANRYTPVSVPGSLAPHALVNGASLYDLFGSWYTVIGFAPQLQHLEEQLTACADSLGIPVTHRTIDSPEIAALYAAKFVIVRPDQHVAWTGDELPNDLPALWRTVSGRRLPTFAEAVSA